MKIDTRNVPADLIAGDKKLTGLLAELAQLDAAHAEAFKARDNATRELDAAPQSDSAAYAAALRQGKGDPGPAAQRAAEEKVSTAQRKLDGAELASAEVAAEISDRVRETAPALRKRIAADDDKARAAIGKALDLLDAAMDKLADSRHAELWVSAVAGNRAAMPAPAEPTLLITQPGGVLGQTEDHRVGFAAVRDGIADLVDPGRVATRETQRSRSMAPGVPQNLSPAELVHGRGMVPDGQPVG